MGSSSSSESFGWGSKLSKFLGSRIAYQLGVSPIIDIHLLESKDLESHMVLRGGIWIENLGLIWILLLTSKNYTLDLDIVGLSILRSIFGIEVE